MNLQCGLAARRSGPRQMTDTADQQAFFQSTWTMLPSARSTCDVPTGEDKAI